jgi:hypothetical protein
MVAVAPRFPQFHSAGKYASLAVQSRPIACLPNPKILETSWGGGRLTSQIPLFKMTIVGLLSWGSSGHHKSKNPVNNHTW